MMIIIIIKGRGKEMFRLQVLVSITFLCIPPVLGQ
jgi:hypothetical protein